MNHMLPKLTYEAQRHKEEESTGEEASAAGIGEVRCQSEALDFTPGRLGTIVRTTHELWRLV